MEQIDYLRNVEDNCETVLFDLVRLAAKEWNYGRMDGELGTFLNGAVLMTTALTALSRINLTGESASK